MAGGTIRGRDADVEQVAHGEVIRGAEVSALVERVLGANGVYVPADILLEIEVALRDLFGDAGAAVLYHLSREATKAWSKDVKKDLRLENRHPALFQFFEELAVKNNWGKMRFIHVDSGSAKCDVSIEDCFECSHVRMSDEPVCHFMRGLVAGAASVVFDAEVDALETGCRAQGEASCRFEVKRRL